MPTAKNLSLHYVERPWLRFNKDGDSAGEGKSGEGGRGSSAPSAGGGGGDSSSDKGLSPEEARALRTELEKEKKTNQDLSEVWEQMQKALRADTSNEEREAAVRKVMKRAGYSEKQINEYLSPEAPEEPEEPEKPARRKAQPEEGEDNLAELSKAAARDAQQARLEVLQERFEKAMDRAFDGETDLGKLLAGVKEAKGEKAFKTFLESVREEVGEAAQRAMIDRRRREQRFEASWVAEEVKKAAEKTEKKYRPVIADLNKVGRSPETEAGEAFLKSEPVKAPKYPVSGEKGVAVSQGKIKLKEYTEDALTRLAVSGGRTKT